METNYTGEGNLSKLKLVNMYTIILTSTTFKSGNIIFYIKYT